MSRGGIMKRSLAALGNNKYFKQLTIVPTKQAGVTDALRKAKSYITEGKEQIRQGKEVLRTGRIPGSSRVYSKEVYTKWGKDKIRLGKANKLTGVTIYRKLKMRGLDVGRFTWSGKPWSSYHKGKKISISKEGTEVVSKKNYDRRKRDQGWGKIVTKKPTNPISERAKQMLSVAFGINSRNPSQRKIKVALEHQAYKMLNSTGTSAFGEGISRGIIRRTTSKLKNSKSIWAGRNITVRTQRAKRKSSNRK